VSTSKATSIPSSAEGGCSTCRQEVLRCPSWMASL